MFWTQLYRAGEHWFEANDIDDVWHFAVPTTRLCHKTHVLRCHVHKNCFLPSLLRKMTCKDNFAIGLCIWLPAQATKPVSQYDCPKRGMQYRDYFTYDQCKHWDFQKLRKCDCLHPDETCLILFVENEFVLKFHSSSSTDKDACS